MIALDTETDLITPWAQFPPVACVATCDAPDRDAMIWEPSQAPIGQWLGRGLIGANLAFDAGVICANWPEQIPAVFDAYESGRVSCVQVRQKLIDIAEGRYRGFRNGPNGLQKIGYALDDLTSRHTALHVDKKNPWRLRFGELRGTPIASWPREAIAYALDDAKATMLVHREQEGSRHWLANEQEQCRADFALKLTSAAGLRTDPAAVGYFAHAVNAWHADLAARLQGPCVWLDGRPHGLVRADGSRDTKTAAARMLLWCEQEGIEVVRTAKGAIALDADTCTGSGDPILALYGEYGQAMAVKSKDLEFLARGTREPICCRYEVLVETGRTSSSKPNVQNLRTLPGIREAFIPPPGCVFASADFGGLELATMAEACLALVGWSKLADTLRAGRDPHVEIASRLLRLPYAEAMALYKAGDSRANRARQTGKVANFGFPGGLAPATLVDYARALYGLEITLAEAVQLKAIWLDAYPEFRDYFRIVSGIVERGNGIDQCFVGRRRGKIRFTSACNTLFQGLGADVAKRAGWRIVKACFAEPASPLYGARPVAFVHDEWILTCREKRGHEVAEELSRVMVASAAELCRKVPIKAEPVLSRRWSKKAKPIRDASGRLVPWDADYQTLVKMRRAEA